MKWNLLVPFLLSLPVWGQYAGDGCGAILALGNARFSSEAEFLSIDSAVRRYHEIDKLDSGGQYGAIKGNLHLTKNNQSDEDTFVLRYFTKRETLEQADRAVVAAWHDCMEGASYGVRHSLTVAPDFASLEWRIEYRTAIKLPAADEAKMRLYAANLDCHDPRVHELATSGALSDVLVSTTLNCDIVKPDTKIAVRLESNRNMVVGVTDSLAVSPPKRFCKVVSLDPELNFGHQGCLGDCASTLFGRAFTKEVDVYLVCTKDSCVYLTGEAAAPYSRDGGSCAGCGTNSAGISPPGRDQITAESKEEKVLHYTLQSAKSIVGAVPLVRSNGTYMFRAEVTGAEVVIPRRRPGDRLFSGRIGVLLKPRAFNDGQRPLGLRLERRKGTVETHRGGSRRHHAHRELKQTEAPLVELRANAIRVTLCQAWLVTVCAQHDDARRRFHVGQQQGYDVFLRANKKDR